MVQEMQKVGIVVEKHHHEVATGGQAEIDMLYAPLVQQADNLMWYNSRTMEAACIRTFRYGRMVLIYLPERVMPGFPI